MLSSIPKTPWNNGMSHVEIAGIHWPQSFYLGVPLKFNCQNHRGTLNVKHLLRLFKDHKYVTKSVLPINRQG